MVTTLVDVLMRVFKRGPDQQNMGRMMMQPFRFATNKPVKFKTA
jgi:hypothetical protein